MSMNRLCARLLGLALPLAMAAVLAGCSGSPQDRGVERSDVQVQMLRARALNQTDR